jgi:endonuclease/exonuclease/phosphatase (EEP) superfamily protein YafD
MSYSKLTLTLPFLLSSCIWTNHNSANDHQHSTQIHGHTEQAITVSAETCPDVLQPVTTYPEDQQFFTNTIRLLNWNAQKLGHVNAHSDLARLGNEADLILIQETVMDSEHMEQVSPLFHWVYAPGYTKTGISTGVMTASRVKPLSSCILSSREPWLGTPKATNITRYALSDSEQTLLVINVHLINFTMSARAMRDQLNEALAFVVQHSGPVIVSGDFNTWTNKRATVVAETMARLGLLAVQFDDDSRTKIFGHPVDHVFVRGIDTTVAKSIQLDSSDHNPISAVLEIQL